MLTCTQREKLESFVYACTHKREYRHALAIKMRGDGLTDNAVAEQLAVSRQSISKWTAAFMKKGIEGIRAAKRKRLVSDARARAMKRIRRLLCDEPAEFGCLKGRWVTADTTSFLNCE